LDRERVKINGKNQPRCKSNGYTNNNFGIYNYHDIYYMIVIIPLGGLGTRFKSNGYKKPKALINIFGKPILYYLLNNLNLESIEYICIPYNKEYALYNFEDKLCKDYPSIPFKFIKLNANTDGAAHTINIALKKLETIDKPVICLDGDNFYTTDIIQLWKGKNTIITFEDTCDKPIYSYIQTKGNKVIDIIEKTKISNNACCGAYGFASSQQLLAYTQKILDNKIKQKDEYYTSTVIKEMILDDINFNYSQIDSVNYHCLGTPLHLRYFYNNYPNISCLNNKKNISQQRICFDLDNTLVTFPKVTGDYTSVEPIERNIRLLRYLKTFGHTIIIYTARKMKTCNGNIGKIMCNIGRITFDTLDKFNIPFDEIYFGKPYADVYIDDLAINCFDDIERELGYYIDKIETRKHNTLETNISIDTYTKKSNDLSGEIYYYLHIPNTVKDLFPLFIDYDVNKKWYTMENVKGMTVTELYTNELLTTETLTHIMNSIHRLHTSVVLDENSIDNMYDNYAKKLKKRYESYDYSRFENHAIVFESLMRDLTNYQETNMGKFSIIHGDPVMSNIIINHFGKIKFIDMRGKNGDVCTIYGDIFYDWAKLYQSLIGYDKIMMRKTMDASYEKKMLETFKTYFLQLYSAEYFNYLKIITQSLLFTLIPLHNNDLCIEYYNLIDTV